MDEVESNILHTEAEDYEIDDGLVRVVIPKEAFMATKVFLQDKGYKIEEADLQFLPTTTIDLDDTTYEKLERLIEMLEEDDDTDIVRHNAA
ncbi:MAG: YebC/PmpR family DNA-binding transcriptional regulator [bacterium]|nr:YebC/PmpR family DNA-binding transcriptional regulator [bacterium]